MKTWTHPKDRGDTRPAHAKLGPSGAKRWMTCTKSMKFEQQFQDQESEFAMEGTDAHTYAEMIVNAEWDNIAIFKQESEFYNGEMEEEIRKYIDMVYNEFSISRYYDPNAILIPEMRVYFEEWVPEGFGTADTTIIGGGWLKLIDLKYGKGVPVQAYDNPQLKIYALGAYMMYKSLYDIKNIEMVIGQPRLNSLTRFTMSVEDLLKWADSELKPLAHMAYNGGGEYKAGDHCRFCRGKQRCKVYAEYMMGINTYGFRDPNLLTNADLGDILSRVDAMVNWASDVKSYALSQAENKGAKIPGWKLVEGRSNRIIKNQEMAVTLLIQDGWRKELLYKDPELRPMSEIEKLVGPKVFSNILGNTLIKPAGRPTLVRADDPRPELNSQSQAQKAFSLKL